MMPIILTTCTNRKRHEPHNNLHACNLPRGTLEQTAEKWWQAVKSSEAPYVSTDLYCGRSFQEARQASETVGGNLHVISAGLGLVSPNQRIPAYGLTLAKGAKDYVRDRVTEPIDEGRWWTVLTNAIGRPSPISRLIRENTNTPILMATSEGYLRMIANDLSELSQSDKGRMRIFGPRDLTRIPESLCDYIMPYGETFDGPDSPIPGTRGDFAQRALRHFVETILPISDNTDDPSNDRDLVAGLANNWKPPKKISRKQQTDDEIMELVQRLWEPANGSSSRMLRLLRDRELIACEQGRFATLFKTAKERHGLA